MKVWFIRRGTIFFSKKRSLFLCYAGLFVLGWATVLLKRDSRRLQERLDKVSIESGRADLLMALLRRRLEV